MPNPTGSTYLTANTGYTWTDGDVYQIPQTDQVEGAATGASFGGQGVDNQPHQTLLNKLNFLFRNQVTDKGTIAALQAAIFTSGVGTTGWLKLGSTDIMLGLIHPIFQWGSISTLPFIDSTGKVTVPTQFPVAFKIPFPTACWVLFPYWATNSLVTSGQNTDPMILPVKPLLTQNNVLTWLNVNSVPPVIYRPSAPPPFNLGVTAINWFAFGY